MLDQYRGSVSALSAEHRLIGAALTRHQNVRGEPLTFRTMPFLIELYADLPTMGDVDIQACVQAGKSELMLLHMLDVAGWQGRIATFVLPTTGIRNRFVQNRVDKLIREVDTYRARTPRGEDVEGVDNLASKRFGSGALLFLSARTPTDWVEFSTDLMVIDEYDKCDKTHLSKARDRLTASRHPQLIRVGNPSMPGQGTISELYGETDRRRYHYRCDCGHWQPIDWLQSVVREDEATGAWIPRDTERYRTIQAGTVTDIRPVCAACRNPFDRHCRAAWVAENPETGLRRGYWLSRLDILSQPLWPLFVDWVAAQTSPDHLKRFWNSVLGAPYEPVGLRVTEMDLERSATEPPSQIQPKTAALRDVPVVAGIDVGKVLNITISEIADEDEKTARRGRYIGAVRQFEELRQLCQDYAVDVAVIDAMPETRKASEFRQWGQANGVRVYLCRFHGQPRTGPEWCGIRVKDLEQEVHVNRTGLLDETLAELRTGLRTIPSDYALVLGFAAQMMAPIRRLNAAGDRYVWQEGSKADHYRLADGYERVAAELHRRGGGTLELDLSSAFTAGQTSGRRRRRRR